MQQFQQPLSYSYQPVNDIEKTKQKQISPIDFNLLKPNCGNGFSANACYLITEIIINALFWFAVYMIISMPIYLIGLMVWMFLVSFIFNCILSYNCQIYRYLQHVMKVEEVTTYSQKMRTTNPDIQYYTYAYHTTGSGKHRRTVYTWRNTAKLTYQNCTDITPDISSILASCSLVRFNSKLIWHAGNQVTADNWKKLGDFEREIAYKRDHNVVQRDTSAVPGQINEILAYSSEAPCFLNLTMYHLFHLLQLGIIFDLVFYSTTGQFTYNVQKIISQNQGIVLDALSQQMMNAQMQQPMNVNFQQPMNANPDAYQQMMMAQQPQQQFMQPNQMGPFVQNPGFAQQQFQQNNAQVYPSQMGNQFGNPQAFGMVGQNPQQNININDQMMGYNQQIQYPQQQAQPQPQQQFGVKL